MVHLHWLSQTNGLFQLSIWALNLKYCFSLSYFCCVELTGAISVVDAFGVEEGEAGSLSHGRLEQGVLRS